jgi:hypothetical protein
MGYPDDYQGQQVGPQWQGGGQQWRQGQAAPIGEGTPPGIAAGQPGSPGTQSGPTPQAGSRSGTAPQVGTQSGSIPQPATQSGTGVEGSSSGTSASQSGSRPQ